MEKWCISKPRRITLNLAETSHWLQNLLKNYWLHYFNILFSRNAHLHTQLQYPGSRIKTLWTISLSSFVGG